MSSNRQIENKSYPDYKLFLVLWVPLNRETGLIQSVASLCIKYEYSDAYKQLQMKQTVLAIEEQMKQQPHVYLTLKSPL